MNGEMQLIDKIAHHGDEDCGYNVGRECDCSAPNGLVKRMDEAGVSLVETKRLDWFWDLKEAVSGLIAHAATKYPDQAARSNGWWTVHQRLQDVWKNKP